jgi:hypothetical protein
MLYWRLPGETEEKHRTAAIIVEVKKKFAPPFSNYKTGIPINVLMCLVAQ